MRDIQSDAGDVELFLSPLTSHVLYLIPLWRPVPYLANDLKYSGDNTPLVILAP